LYQNPAVDDNSPRGRIQQQNYGRLNFAAKTTDLGNIHNDNEELKQPAYDSEVPSSIIMRAHEGVVAPENFQNERKILNSQDLINSNHSSLNSPVFTFENNNHNHNRNRNEGTGQAPDGHSRPDGVHENSVNQLVQRGSQ